MMRPVASVLPPGENGMTMRTSLFGNVGAKSGWGGAGSAVAMSVVRIALRMIRLPVP